MSVKLIAYDRSAQIKIQRGVDELANAVRVTLGPKGRNVLIEKVGPPRITKDGVTVALEIVLPNSFENMGTEMVRDVAARTSAMAGDGTTTAIVLAQVICREGMKLVAAGHHPLEVKVGIDLGVLRVLETLKGMSRPVETSEEIAHVGTISANGDESIGKLLSEAMSKVGKHGVISVDESKGLETTIEVVEGLEFGNGYLSPYFITDLGRIECVLEDALILLSYPHISSMAQLVPILEAAVEAQRSLLIIAEDVTDDGLSTLVINKLNNVLKCCAVKSPGLGAGRKEHLKDLSLLLGASIVGDETGLSFETVKLEHLGRAKRIVISPTNTVIVGAEGSRSEIQGRVAHLSQALAEAKEDRRKPKIEKDDLATRLARLSGGVALIRVGGPSELEMKERKDRTEDAYYATRAAAEEGVVPGGGVALLRCQNALEELEFANEEQRAGIRLLGRALEEPLRRIAENAGLDASVVVDRVRQGETGFGLDAAQDEYKDLLAAGIIDPTKVVRSALECAANVAGLLLTTQAMMVHKHPRDLMAGPDFEDLEGY